MTWPVKLAELGRGALRIILPRRLYAAAHRALNATAARRALGRTQYRRLRDASHATAGSDGFVRLEAPALMHPFHIRPNRTDPVTFMQNVVRETYGRLLPAEDPRFIVDAGACIGDSTAWYLSRFPAARVVAIEPVTRHFEILQRNIAPYGSRADLIHGALWPRDVPVALGGDQRGRASYVLETGGEGGEAACPGVSPLTLLERYGETTIDLFKIDIEGGEIELFGDDACDAWLRRTGTVYIEIHGPDAERVVLAAMRRNGFVGQTYRELHIFRRPEALARSA